MIWDVAFPSAVFFVQTTHMSSVFQYGVQSSVELDLPEDVLVARLDGPRDALVANAAAAVAEALTRPLDFPPQ